MRRACKRQTQLLFETRLTESHTTINLVEVEKDKQKTEENNRTPSCSLPPSLGFLQRIRDLRAMINGLCLGALAVSSQGQAAVGEGIVVELGMAQRHADELVAEILAAVEQSGIEVLLIPAAAAPT